MNQASMERDDVLMKCMSLAQGLQLTFPTKQYDGDAYLPHVIQNLVHAQALPVELMPSLTFVSSVYQQLTQSSQYVEPSVLQTVLYHMQIPPLNSFVTPPTSSYGLPSAPMFHHPHHHPYLHSNNAFTSPPYYSGAFPQYSPSHMPPSSPASGSSSRPMEPPSSFFGDAYATCGNDLRPHRESPSFDASTMHFGALSPSSSSTTTSFHRPEPTYNFSQEILRHASSSNSPGVDTTTTSYDDDLDSDAALALSFQPFLDSLTHDDEDDDDEQQQSRASPPHTNNSRPTTTTHSSAPEPHPETSIDAASVTSTSHSDDDLLLDVKDQENNHLSRAKGHEPEDASDDRAPSPPKRRYLYDAPTPLEIQKQSVQIHMQHDERHQHGEWSADDVRRATSTWIARMQEQGHAFDDKAAQKFHELAAADPYRAVGITVSFDIRKDTIQNKSAWLARACFNCQRKQAPSAAMGKPASINYRKLLSAKQPKTASAAAK
ncbi:Aste57867_15887 [Aphanomyces stellatus]|uniref:Aste57867_15887 protein n=1 Tax=Aphanomyces stellatus TaxID=120398 RepID=A0A485L7B5_9STRA|nr:hypothetical protein As57867_015831 [Aphanomyces stellatus]VFT92674.1 Aste57867_15887 [Aphanomyces stellatus]